ncbi:hypothetical protein MJO29_013262 [Puccinia striiformis f. sp. tritici]|uniref:Uncharacterized protein n=1 Tax=Puccinia striiformis f. sp. tritici PST-78 TaxID=1165861 RepID=A0A0L0UPX4_9BASI|nr:hypothetical protein MJO29_013262 [Puccinia striiformis f. sp. tritici]KNE89132.1 hypothetical protein PSTG_17407 [Puccinia striiformis f. sp. tritici PST-78]
MSTVMPSEWDPSSIFCTGSGYGPCPAATAPRNAQPPPNLTTTDQPKPVPTTANDEDGSSADPVVDNDDDEGAKPDPRPNFQNPGSSPFADIPTGSGSTDSPFGFPNLRPERPDTPAEFPPVRAKVVEQFHVEQCRKRVRQIFFEFIRHNSLRNLRGRTRENRTRAGPTEQPWSSTSLLHAVMEEFDATTNMGEHVEMTFI